MLKKLSFLFVSLLLVVSSLASGVTGAASAQSATFKDISNHWAKDAIMQAVAKGYVQGYPDGTFKPDNPVQADEFIKMFILALSGPSSYPNRPVFWTDAVWDRFDTPTKQMYAEKFANWDFKQAKNGYWAKPYIDVADMVLFGGGTYIYDFTADLKRIDVARLVYLALNQLEFHEQPNYANRALSGYKDLGGLTEQEKSYVAEVMTKGIMNGYSTQYFGVNKLVTRAEALAIIERFLDKSQRSPAKIDLTNVPHTVVSAFYGMYQGTIVFNTQKQKSVYDKSLELVQKYAPDRYEEDLGNIILFKDSDQKMANDYARSYSFDASADGEINMDIEHYVYSVRLFVSDDGKSFERQEDLILDYLAFHVGEQEALKIVGEILSHYNKLKEQGEDVKPYSRNVGSYLVTIGSNTRVNSVGVTLSEYH